MNQKEPVYITGHQHPDTDSVASAIAYAFFKRANGIKAIPCRLGELNTETKYLLNRFGFDEPMYLEDARKKISDIEIDEPYSISPETTVRETIVKMEEYNRNSFGVVDEEQKLIGYVSKSDLANIALGDTAAEIELLIQTPVEDIAKAIDGEIIYEDTERHINGKVSIIALTNTNIERYEVRDRIVIVGDDPQAHIGLIDKGAGMLIVVWTKEIDPAVLEHAKNAHCQIIRSGHGSMNTSRYLFLAPPVKLIMTKNPVTFKSSMLAEEAGQKMMKTRFRSYPVLDENGCLQGYISRYHVLNLKNKKVILVDHNEFSQSVKAVEKAQILEVVDHHRINDFATSQPVSFRNEIVGSTATIVSTMFRENQIPIPANLAGLLLGAVLSDTLLFQSPTTTQKDKDVANILAALADLDIEDFGKEMFSSTSANPNQSIREMIVQDIKYYDINGCKVMISQVIVPYATEMRNRGKEIKSDMENLANKKEIDLLVVAFTSVIEDGTVFFACGEQAAKCTDAFPDIDGIPNSFQKGVLSRKSQILPRITEVIN